MEHDAPAGEWSDGVDRVRRFVNPYGEPMRGVLSVVIVATIGILLLGGCATSETARLSRKNQEAIPGLLTRMEPKEVVSFMKGEPYKTEYCKGKNGEAIIVYEYLTNPPDSNGEVTDNNLTPIFFVNYELEGWGWSYLETVKKKYEPVFLIKF